MWNSTASFTHSCADQQPLSGHQCMAWHGMAKVPGVPGWWVALFGHWDCPQADQQVLSAVAKKPKGPSSSLWV